MKGVLGTTSSRVPGGHLGRPAHASSNINCEYKYLVRKTQPLMIFKKSALIGTKSPVLSNYFPSHRSANRERAADRQCDKQRPLFLGLHHLTS